MKVSSSLTFIFSTLTLLMFVSCTQKDKEAAAFKDIAAALAESAKNLDRAAERKTQEFSAKLDDKGLEGKAELYLPKLSAIRNLSEQSSGKIDSLSLLLSNKNHEAITAAAAGIYQSHINGLLTVSDEFKIAFPHWLSQKQQPESYYTLPLAKIFLSKIQYQINNANASAITFLDSKLAYNCGLIFDRPGFLISQSSTVMEPGQTLEISAGVGSYSTTSQASFRINDKPVDYRDDPYVTSKFKVPQQAGNYKVPVEISYIGQDGERVIKSFMLEYKVVMGVE